MIDLEQVRTYVAIVEAGSFQSAAARLGIAQPTASQHMRKLEETLGHRLIERTRAQAVPTAEGARFLPFAREQIRIRHPLQQKQIFRFQRHRFFNAAKIRFRASSVLNTSRPCILRRRSARFT